MKVLLLGATGNVGSRLIPALLAHHHQVVVFVRSAGKIPASVTARLSAVIEGSGTDSAAIKAAILKEDCNVVINAAGQAAFTSWHAKTDLRAIFLAVVTAVVEAGKERGGPPIRCWLMSGFGILDSPKKPYLLGDYLPIYPEHLDNFNIVQKFSPTTDLAWSLLCANNLPPRNTPPAYPHPADATASNLVTKPDFPPDWSPTLSGIPFFGTFFNILANAPGYETPLEDTVDVIASDLDKGLESEFIGTRVALKAKAKAG